MTFYVTANYKINNCSHESNKNSLPFPLFHSHSQKPQLNLMNHLVLDVCLLPGERVGKTDDI
jgi:hypothetical protein